MRINGSWRVRDDGIVRPVIRGEARADDGSWVQMPFLLDTAADRTVLSADVLASLHLSPLESEHSLEGVGGRAATVLVATQIRMRRDDGVLVSFTGTIAAFTDPHAIDMCVLGRDITNLFAAIADRPQDVVCMLSGKHRYVIVEE